MPTSRTFTQNVRIAAGTPAGPLAFKTVLDTQYSQAKGFAVYVNQDGGLPTFQMGLRDDSQVYASLTNVDYFRASTDCPKSERLTPVVIKCDNTQLSIQVTLPAQLNFDLDLDVIFHLERA